MKKLLLFDLDDTLLRSDKTISDRTLIALHKCRDSGYLIGVSTSRSEQNCMLITNDLELDVIITSGGALINRGGNYIFNASFSIDRTNEIISIAKNICGSDTEITVDTVNAHFWNYNNTLDVQDVTWGDSLWTDYSNFKEEALKICVEIPDISNAVKLKSILSDCDCVKYSDGNWYKFTKKGITKGNSIHILCRSFCIKPYDIIAFGDDFADIEMIQLAGVGIAMGNAVKDLKDIADIVIGTNDEDAIALYLESIV